MHFLGLCLRNFFSPRILLDYHSLNKTSHHMVGSWFSINLFDCIVCTKLKVKGPNLKKVNKGSRITKKNCPSAF
jgi:hypothetical protein